MHRILMVGILALIFWLGRRIKLAGRRKWLAIACRAVAAGAMCAALWGAPHRHAHEVPQHLIYLVDGSASIDAVQQAWMARRIASLESIRPKALERAVIAFGADAHVVMPFGHEPLTDPETIQRSLEHVGLARGQTNIEGGLLAALAMLPPHHRGSVVLLSDGRETVGNVTGILSNLHRFGLEIDPVPTPMFGPVKTVWETLAVPPVVKRGSPVAVQLLVFNGSSRTKSGQVTIDLHGVTIKRQRVGVPPGWQVVTASLPAIGRGTMALDVHFAIPADRLEESRRAYTEVEGPPQVLLVGEHVAALPVIATALKRREIEVAVAHPTEFPTEPSQLLDDDAVLFFNIAKSSLSESQVTALQSYVERFGGGVVMAGLGGDLAHEVSTPAPLDALLPVHFEPKGLQEAKRRVCVILLIDRSASMIGPRIAATKRAAVELVKQLAPEDLVGILAFDTQPYIVAEVQPAGQIEMKLVEKLVKLRSSGGTDIYPALVAAAKRAELTGATVKHILLLSDGVTPVEEKAYQALFESLNVHGTTVSTIGIGAVFVNADYLKWVAKSTGGTFYQMRNLDELPRLIVNDTQQALGRLPFAEGYFRPTKTSTSEWFAEVSDWPALRGYFTTTARVGAQVDLTVNGGEGDDPLLARWSVGRGRVVSFTSDADRRWSPEWIRWPGFEGTWAQIVRWAMRPRFTEELFAWVDETHNVPQLVLEGELQDPRTQLIPAEGSGSFPLSLMQAGTWRWHATLEQVPSGWYQLVLESHLPTVQNTGSTDTAHAGAGASPIFAKRWIQIGTPPVSQEVTGQPPREAFLQQLARTTSGAYDTPDRALLPPTTIAMTTEPVFIWWLPLVVIALLLDIALRGASML